ncbi:MAG: shikimate dehydrogenase [Verrucomicrobiaceae bacterium]|nr:MAG: shikimate dehydrogenase [Verrucomicrobiaceae bacterium]
MSEVYSADDLIGGGEIFSRLEPPARLGVFGDPVEHSKSPLFQNAALKAAGVKAQYVKIHVPREKASAAFRALPDAGFIGTNVTLPLKAEALASVDEADEYARRSGSVNTLAVQGEKLLGFNTDGPGLMRAIREEFFVDLRDLRVVLLGAGGGAGRAIAVQCAMESCERLVLVNRTLDKARALAAELAPSFRSDRLVGPIERLQVIGFEEDALREQLAHADLVINATSVGMQRTDAPLIPPSLFTPNLMVYDTVYAAGRSRLLEDAAAAGARCASGLSMLLHQGALSFEIWFNRPAPLEVMRKALLENS